MTTCISTSPYSGFTCGTAEAVPPACRCGPGETPFGMKTPGAAAGGV